MGRKKTSYVYKFFHYDQQNNVSLCQCRVKQKTTKTQKRPANKRDPEDAELSEFDSNLCLISIKGSKASNLKQHLRYNHPDEYNEMVRVESQTCSGTTISSICITSMRVEDNPASKECYVVKKRKLENHRKKKFPDISLVKNEIVKGILQLIVLDGCHIDIVEGEGLRTLLGPSLSHTGLKLDKNLMETIIDEKAGDIQRRISDKISQYPLISLKLACTTMNKRSFVSINCLLLETVEDELTQNEYFLACVEIFDHHGRQIIEEFIMSSLIRYEISVDKIHVITTENGSRVLQLKEYAMKSQNDRSNSELGTEINTADIDKTEDLLRTIGEFSIRETRCLVHEIFMCVQNAFQDKSETGGIQDYIEILEKVRDVVQLLHSSSVFDSMELNIPLCVSDCFSSWTSAYTMLDSILKLKMNFDEIVILDPSVFLSDDEWQIIKEIVTSLRPIYHASLQMGNSQLLPGDLYKIWKLCYIETSKIGSQFSDYLMKTVLEKQVALFNNINFKSSLFLDPRFLVELNEDEKTSVTNYLVDLYKHYEKSVRNDETQNSSNDDHAEIENDAEYLLEQYLMSREQTQRFYKPLNAKTSENELQAEFGAYVKLPRLQLKGSVLEFWDKKRFIFPKLYDLALIIHSVQYTPTSAGQLYSSVKYVLDASKKNLKSDLLENILILRINHHMFL